MSISSEFFLYFTCSSTPHQTFHELYDCGRLPGDVVKRSINSNPLYSRVHAAISQRRVWRISRRESAAETGAVFPGETRGGGYREKNARRGNLSLFALSFLLPSVARGPPVSFFSARLPTNGRPADQPTDRPAGHIYII